jgi:hypothetical protein
MDANQLLVLMATVGDPLGPDLSSLGGGVEGTAMFQGVPLELKHNPGSKNAQPSLDIRLLLPFPCPLTVRLETVFDRMGKAIGLAHEIQGGDLMFDREYYVECEHRSFAGPFLSSSGHRDAARRLLQEIPHAAYVRGDHDGVTLRISPFKEDQFNRTHLAQVLPLLKRFGSEIPQMPSFPRRINPLIPLFIIGWLVLLVGLVAFNVGIGAVFYPGGHRVRRPGIRYASRSFDVDLAFSFSHVPHTREFRIPIICWNHLGQRLLRRFSSCRTRCIGHPQIYEDGW